MVVKSGKTASKFLAKRIAGISAFGFGISWKAPESEREIVRQLITLLEDRRVLYVDGDREIQDYVNRSLHEIRGDLTATLVKLDEGSPAIEAIRLMRAACRDFLTENQLGMGRRTISFHDGDPSYDRRAQKFFIDLGRLRAIFGQQLAVLSLLYKIDVEKELASILPPDPDHEALFSSDLKRTEEK